MLSNDAEARLKEFNDTAFPKKMITITDRVRIAVGWGHSNCIIVEGDTSLILVDTLDSDARAARLKDELSRLTDKPVKTIIFTHGHPDHRGGCGAFRDTVEEIIAFAPKKAVLKGTERINPILNKRTFRQFGYGLTDEELITQGLGIREGHAIGDGVYSFLPPTTLYTEDSVTRTIDGVAFEMVSAVGETDDQIFLWLPEERIMCCGDNYYGCWPNLYAIRGTQYRDIAQWIKTLEKILSYPAEALLPGHTAPLMGRSRIQEVVGNFKNAIASVFDQTLDCLGRGLTLAETVESVRLPEELRDMAESICGQFLHTARRLTDLGLGYLSLDRAGDTLSTGERQRVQLARAVRSRTTGVLYVLDEPIAGVDPAARDYILGTILSNYSEEASVLLSTHLIADIERVLDEVVFIREGVMVLHKDVDAIREETGKSVDTLFREVFAC